MHKLIAQRYTGAVKMTSFSHVFLLLLVYLCVNKKVQKKRFFMKNEPFRQILIANGVQKKLKNMTFR